MPSPTPRSTVLLAAVLGLPVAVLAGLAVFLLLRPDPPATRAEPAATATTVRPPVPSATVPVPPLPSVAAGVTHVCRALSAALPESLDGRTRRATDGDPVRIAAWGEPPVVLGCGVGPSAPTAGAQLVEVNGVAWVDTAVAGATVYTSVGRVVTLQVRVPAREVDESGQTVLVPLAAAVRETVPKR